MYTDPDYEILFSKFDSKHNELRAELLHGEFWEGVRNAFQYDDYYLNNIVIPFEFLSHHCFFGKERSFFEFNYDNVLGFDPDYWSCKDLLDYANRDVYAAFIVDHFLENPKPFKGTKNECIDLFNAEKALIIFSKNNYIKAVKFFGLKNIKQSFYRNDIFYNIIKFYRDVLCDVYDEYMIVRISYLDTLGNYIHCLDVLNAEFQEKRLKQSALKDGYIYDANDFVATGYRLI